MRRLSVPEQFTQHKRISQTFNNSFKAKISDETLLCVGGGINIGFKHAKLCSNEKILVVADKFKTDPQYIMEKKRHVEVVGKYLDMSFGLIIQAVFTDEKMNIWHREQTDNPQLRPTTGNEPIYDLSVFSEFPISITKDLATLYLVAVVLVASPYISSFRANFFVPKAMDIRTIKGDFV